MDNPLYIQQASLQTLPNGMQRVSFTNLSSQQMYPGTLKEFHERQMGARKPMPFTDADIPVPRQALMSQLSERNTNIDQMRHEETMPQYLVEQMRSNKAQYRTPAQRAWGVPYHLTEARETELL